MISADIARSRVAESDKHYWHRYTETYTPLFQTLQNVRVVVELGVFRGDSIAWLAECFPGAHLVGVDILPIQPSWPRSPGITYLQADQADRQTIEQAFASIPGPPDLIIEDGSHIPAHQATCLSVGFASLRPGGHYILEDICTSHPATASFAHHTRHDGLQLPTTLHVLMALQHLRDTGAPLSADVVDRLSHPDYLSSADIDLLWHKAAAIDIHRRTKLPLRCWSCGGADFDYVAWTCGCGVPLYEPTNSMTAIIRKSADT